MRFNVLVKGGMNSPLFEPYADIDVKGSQVWWTKGQYVAHLHATHAPSFLPTITLKRDAFAGTGPRSNDSEPVQNENNYKRQCQWYTI